jgi:hypothetical protein
VKRVYDTESTGRAFLVRGLLEAYGIVATVRGEAPVGTGSGESPSVWIIDDSMEAEAQAIISQQEAARTAADDRRSGWRCARCGQELEAQFSACWHCGGERAL